MASRLLGALRRVVNAASVWLPSPTSFVLPTLDGRRSTCVRRVLPVSHAVAWDTLGDWRGRWYELSADGACEGTEGVAMSGRDRVSDGLSLGACGGPTRRLLPAAAHVASVEFYSTSGTLMPAPPDGEGPSHGLATRTLHLRGALPGRLAVRQELTERTTGGGVSTVGWRDVMHPPSFPVSSHETRVALAPAVCSPHSATHVRWCSVYRVRAGRSAAAAGESVRKALLADLDAAEKHMRARAAAGGAADSTASR